MYIEKFRPQYKFLLIFTLLFVSVYFSIKFMCLNQLNIYCFLDLKEKCK